MISQSSKTNKKKLKKKRLNVKRWDWRQHEWGAVRWDGTKYKWKTEGREERERRWRQRPGCFSLTRWWSVEQSNNGVPSCGESRKNKFKKKKNCKQLNQKQTSYCPTFAEVPVFFGGEEIVDFQKAFLLQRRQVGCSSSTPDLRVLTKKGIPEGPKWAEDEKTKRREVTLAEVP